jgi:uncharacterized protein YgiM (DUF1202 family)
MKRSLILFTLGILVAAGAAAQSRTMYVSAKDAPLKSSTGFFADTLATLNYGDQVTVLRENGRWMEVRPARQTSLTGWMHSDNLTTRRIVQSDTSASASANELALAGKMFTAEVEKSYKQSTALDYAALDAVEAQTLPPEELYRFLAEGHLSLGDEL